MRVQATKMVPKDVPDFLKRFRGFREPRISAAPRRRDEPVISVSSQIIPVGVDMPGNW